MFDIFLKVFILTTALWWHGKGGIILNANKVFMIGTVILFFLSITRMPVRRIKLIYPAVLFGYCALNFIYWNLNHLFFPVFINIALGALLFHMIVTYAEDLDGIVNTVKLLIFINIAMITLQALKLDPIFDIGYSHSLLHGFCERTGSMSALILLAAPFCPFLLVVPYLLPNFTGMIAAALLGSVMLIRKKMLVPAILVFLVLAVFMTANRDSLIGKLNTRKELLFKATQVTLTESPIFGLGLGAFQHSKLAKDKSWDTEMKCEPIEWLFWAGVLGWIALGLFIKDIVRRMLSNKNAPHVFKLSLAILGFAVMSLSQGVFQNPKLMAVFIPMLAIFYIKTEQYRKENSPCLSKM